MYRILFFFFTMNLTIVGSEQSNTLYRTLSKNNGGLIRVNSVMEAFMQGRLDVIEYRGKTCVKYPDYTNCIPNQTNKIFYYTSPDNVHYIIATTFSHICSLGTVKCDEQLLALYKKKRLSEEDRASIQAIRLHDFMIGKISYSQSVVKKASQILDSLQTLEEKKHLLCGMEAGFNYNLIKLILTNRTQYIEAFSKQDISFFKKNWWALDWAYMPLYKFSNEVERICRTPEKTY